jgi:hypothetical protein
MVREARPSDAVASVVVALAIPSTNDTRTPGWVNPSRSRRRPTIPPANPVTPYDPRVAVRTMSMTARRLTIDRPGVDAVGTRAATSDCRAVDVSR